MLQTLFAFLLSVFSTSMSPLWFVLKSLQHGQHIRNLPADWKKLIVAHESFSDLGKLSRSCLQIAIASYNIWFWVKGVDSLKSISPCEPVAFLFVPIHLDGPERRFYQTAAIIYFHFTSMPYGFIGRCLSFILRRRIEESWMGVMKAMKSTTSLKEKFSQIWQSYISMSLPQPSLFDQIPLLPM